MAKDLGLVQAAAAKVEASIPFGSLALKFIGQLSLKDLQRKISVSFINFLKVSSNFNSRNLMM